MEVEHVAELGRPDEVGELRHGRVETMQVSRNHGAAAILGRAQQLLRLSGLLGEHTCDVDVLVGFQGGRSQFVTRRHRGHDHHRVDQLVAEQVGEPARL